MPEIIKALFVGCNKKLKTWLFVRVGKILGFKYEVCEQCEKVRDKEETMKRKYNNPNKSNKLNLDHSKWVKVHKTCISERLVEDFSSKQIQFQNVI